MPRLSATTLLSRAIEAAVQDRLSLADCYSKDAPMQGTIMEQVSALRALRGKRFEKLAAPELATAFEAFIYAEQWEESLADANHRRGPAGRDALLALRLYKEFRLARWGRTALEATMAKGATVDVYDLLRNKDLRT